MENERFSQRGSVMWVVDFAVAAVLFTIVFGWLRLRPTGVWSWRALLPAVVVALTAFVGFVWQSRARAARRWKAALNAYAEREMARDRRRNSDTAQTLKDRLSGGLTDLAYPVVLRQGVKGFSVDVELAIWRAIDGTLQEVFEPLPAKAAQTLPPWGVVLARLTKAVYQAALRHGFRGTFADVEFGLWDAFHTGSIREHADQLLQALVRRAKGAWRRNGRGG